MKITLNGEIKEYRDQLTVQELLQRLNLQPERVVVELNRTILSPENHHSTKLKNGDTVELVQFVGGG